MKYVEYEEEEEGWIIEEAKDRTLRLIFFFSWIVVILYINIFTLNLENSVPRNNELIDVME